MKTKPLREKDYTSIQVRVDLELKNRAKSAFEAMGMSMNDAIRILLTKVADEKKFPFEISAPKQ